MKVGVILKKQKKYADDLHVSEKDKVVGIVMTGVRGNLFADKPVDLVMG